MFVLNFKDITSDGVNGVLQALQRMDMLSQVYTMYTKTQNFNDILSNYQVNTIFADLQDVTEDDFDVDDFILSVLEAEQCPIIRLPKDTEICETFLECVDIYQLKFLNYDTFHLDTAVTLDNLMDYAVMEEIFNSVTNLSKLFTPTQYTVKVLIHDEKVIVNGEEHCMYRFDWRTLYSYINPNILSNLDDGEFFMSKYLITPLPFLLMDSGEVISKVSEYKKRVFERTMSLNAREVSQLPTEVANILTRASYVPLEVVDKYADRLEKLMV